MDYKPSNSTELLVIDQTRIGLGYWSPKWRNFHWAFKSDPTINKQLLANTFELIPEMKTQLSITQEELTCVLRWVRESLMVSDSGSFVGHLSTLIDKINLELGKKKTYIQVIIFI
jgi:hypothetical protein